MENSVIKLSKPIMINGSEVKEIPYDFENLTAQHKQNAGKKYKQAGNVVTVQETDPDYHLYIFAEAAALANPEIDMSDILRMSARDASKAERVVRDFFFLNSEE
jgi:tetrahydromethanopterin S-methyltransferase subunit H